MPDHAIVETRIAVVGHGLLHLRAEQHPSGTGEGDIGVGLARFALLASIDDSALAATIGGGIAVEAPCLGVVVVRDVVLIVAPVGWRQVVAGGNATGWDASGPNGSAIDGRAAIDDAPTHTSRATTRDAARWRATASGRATARRCPAHELSAAAAGARASRRRSTAYAGRSSAHAGGSSAHAGASSAHAGAPTRRSARCISGAPAHLRGTPTRRGTSPCCSPAVARGSTARSAARRCGLARGRNAARTRACATQVMWRFPASSRRATREYSDKRKICVSCERPHGVMSNI